MAQPPKTDEAFLREVDEELRRDQLAGVMTRYGRWLIAAIVVGLLAFAAFLFWQHRREQAAGEEGVHLQAAFDDVGAGRTAEANKKLAPIAASDIKGYRAAALFTQADILLEKQDNKGAAAKFAAIAGDSALAEPYRDLALVRQTAAEFDTLKPQVVVDRLRGLAVKGKPWFGSAGELVGAAYLAMNRPDLAGTIYGQIASDEQVPETIRQRAVQMASTLGVDAGGANKKAQ
ncbi:tetratricopeptide repeat protein [Sphingomonas aracearum]|uniref:Ancillary SecYEG translocon subunit/Cell division coordinator CpoB TPR domain-containing protein n=1 Tax=Sphingomonas aracearum TaxID=2283317 RepID=A0A369VVA7_9SPHN|nr:tetratricopeptide repeat protein [Sphingomonas aracearum]RDE05507.1 hypothetical protein DVW87_09715 [Sphingomonas aracearum]